MSPTPAESNSEAGPSLPWHYCLHKAHLVLVIRLPLRPVGDIPLWGQSTVPRVPQRGSHSFVLNWSPTEAQQMDFMENKSPDYMLNCVRVSIYVCAYICVCMSVCARRYETAHFGRDIPYFSSDFQKTVFPIWAIFIQSI